MKHFYLILTLFLSTCSFAQEKEQPKVERTPGPLNGAVVPTEKRTTSTEIIAEDPANQPRYYVLSRESMETIELTKEGKIAELDQRIESIEGKLFLLSGDPQENAVEIAEKQQQLQELQIERESLKNQ